MQAHRWLRNASGLTWVQQNLVLYSEGKENGAMGIAAAAEDRTKARDGYLPAGPHPMAHRSYASPARKWVLVVEMESSVWLPCRFVPMAATPPAQPAGRQGATLP